MRFAGNKNLYRELSATNIIPGMARGNMFGSGRYVDVNTKKWRKMSGVDLETRWIYTNPNPDLHCMYYRSIFDGYGFVPKKCLDCYKVVVAPRTFDELMKLLYVQELLIADNPKCWCKCGIEQRDFVPRNYGGYFYTRSLEQGQIRYETVRKAVDENISPDIDVVLKRYCTEFEIALGPSNLYKRPDGADDVEKLFWQNVEVSQDAVRQPDFVIRHIVQEWMMWAWGRGDKTVMLYNNNEPFYPAYVTYHKTPKEKKNGKRDME